MSTLLLCPRPEPRGKVRMLASAAVRPAPRCPRAGRPPHRGARYFCRMTALRRTAPYPRHEALGAKLADFGGWLMPIEYPGGGVLKEHEAVRERVGLFDVSHLGKLAVTGPGAAAFVDSCLTNALARIAPGRAQYTLAVDDVTGGVVDDLIVYL